MKRKKTQEPVPHSASALVKAELLKRLGRQWMVGQWLPPVRDLAKALDAGHVSTHQALVELAQEGYVLPLRGKGTRVMKAGTDVVPAAVQSGDWGQAQQLAGMAALDRPPRIAIIRQRQTDPMIHRMIDACMEAAKPMAPQFSFVLVEGAEEQPRLTEPMDAAVVFIPWLKEDWSALLPHARHVVHVTTGAGKRSLRHERVDRVTVDQKHVGYLAGMHLREMGWESAVYLGKRMTGKSRYDVTSLKRLRGFESALGRRLPQEHLMYGHFYGPVTGQYAFQRWFNLTPRPQAIFAASDELACGFLAAAIMQGLKPGVDFQLIGVDGQDRGRNASGFPLTTVQMPADIMGRQAARMLRQRLLEGETAPMRVVLTCSMYRGQTVSSRADIAGKKRTKKNISPSPVQAKTKASNKS